MTTKQLMTIVALFDGAVALLLLGLTLAGILKLPLIVPIMLLVSSGGLYIISRRSR